MLQIGKLRLCDLAANVEREGKTKTKVLAKIPPTELIKVLEHCGEKSDAMDFVGKNKRKKFLTANKIIINFVKANCDCRNIE